ncbi:MAG: septum formation initiator family protein [Patescibacteria group bacterium]|jgi:cell division protein FtsL
MKKSPSAGILRRLLNSKVLIIVELSVVVFFSVAVVKEIIRRWEINHEIKDLQTQINAAKGKSTELSGLIDYFQSDYYREKEARLKLGLQKEGEQAVTIPGMQNTATAMVATYSDTTTHQETVSIPTKWWNYFFKKTN